MGRYGLSLSVALWAFMLNAGPCFAGAQAPPETLITADEITTDAESGMTEASGDVEVDYQGHLLRADRIIYDQRRDVMRAEGNVVIVTPAGDTEFADIQEITGDLKQAVAVDIGVVFPDQSRLAAQSAERYDGRWMVAHRGMYTACDVCHDDPNQPPLWQLRAKTITHDNTAHNLYYRNATVDFAGVPVLYTPYFSMPDPSVKRRQGFLTPTPGNSPNIGAYLRVPYYVDLAPDADLTLAPTFSSEDKGQFSGEYRQRWENAQLKFTTSFTNADLTSENGVDKGKVWRGHMNGTWLYTINNVWRAGTDISLVSDKSYLQRYKIASDDELVNRAYLEGFEGRHYAVVNSYYYQDIRPGDRAVEPLVLPQASFSALGEPGQMLGGRWSFGGGLLMTARDNTNKDLSLQGPNTRRLSLTGGWERRFFSNTGIVTTASGLLRTDMYSADNVVNAEETGVYNQVFILRPFEQATVKTSYPMGRRGDGYQQWLEPIAAVTVSPVVKRDAEQPLEDNRDVEFDETSLFAPNRYSGYDLLEGGTRAIYGIRHAVTTDDNMHVDMFGGQSYAFDGNNGFSEQSGLGKHLSDYVGRLNIAPAPWFDANYGFRLGQDDLSPKRQDAWLSIGGRSFRPFARYISAFQTDSANEISEVKEITTGFTTQMTDFWSFTTTHTQSFSPQPGPRTTSAVLNYIDECFRFALSISRDQTSRADLKAGTSVGVQFYFRNLGGVASGSSDSHQFLPPRSE